MGNWQHGTVISGRFSRIRQEGFSIKAYCDNNMNKWGKDFYGKPIISPSELKRYKDACVLICTPTPKAIREISAQLDEICVSYYLLDEVLLKWHAAEILECYDLLEDKESKRAYADIVLSRIEGRFPSLDICTYGEQYFSHKCFEKASTAEEVFIDCGSYVGDTLEKYIQNRNGLFGKIIAFEPDLGNYAAMQKRAMYLKEEWKLKDNSILLMPFGVADKCTEMAFEHYEQNNGFASKFVQDTDSNGTYCKTVALDEVITDTISFLKADIESYEYKSYGGKAYSTG